MKYTSWDNAFNKFLDSYKVSKSRASFITRKNEFERCKRYLTVPPKEFTDSHLRIMRVRIQEDYAQNCASHTWSSFIRILKLMNHSTYIDADLNRIRAGRLEVAYYSVTELKILYNYCISISPDDTFCDKRTKMWILLLLVTGVRPCEACNIKWSSFDGGTISLDITKTGIKRKAFIPPEYLIHLTNWKQYQDQHFKISSTYIFCPSNNPDKSLKPDLFRTKFNGLKYKFDIHIQARKFRSTICKIIVEKFGYDEAAAVLGHTTIDTTARYYKQITLSESSRIAQTESLHEVLN